MSFTSKIALGVSIACISLAGIVPVGYYQYTKGNKTITPKEKYIKVPIKGPEQPKFKPFPKQIPTILNTGLNSKLMIVDEHDNHYEVGNEKDYLKYSKIKTGKKTQIDYYGFRQPSLGLYPCVTNSSDTSK